MITEAKDLLERVIKKRIKDVTVVRSVKDEAHAVMKRQFPLIALVTNPGPFDGTEARTVRYFDEAENHKYKQRYVRGNRNLPILLRCWSTSESEADIVFSRIIPAIPSRWVYDNFVGSIEIGTEEHSDHTGNVAMQYCSVTEIRFSVASAMEPGEVPYFEEVVLEEGEYIEFAEANQKTLKEDLCPKKMTTI